MGLLLLFHSNKYLELTFKYLVLIIIIMYLFIFLLKLQVKDHGSVLGGYWRFMVTALLFLASFLPLQSLHYGSSAEPFGE